MTISNIQAMVEGLTEVSKKRLPIKVSYVISSNLEKLKPHNEAAEQTRNDLLRQYGEKDEDGNLKFNEKNEIRIVDVTSYVKDVNELMNTDVDISFDKFSLEDLERCEKEDRFDVLTIEEISFLKPMIKAEEEVTEVVP